MSGSEDRWDDGRRAWKRLYGWHQDSPSASPGHPDSGEDAVEALADIGMIRHLLDQAELVAVRTARKHGKSWAEIATKLGVTRQSAWERWRDLDDDAAPPIVDNVIDEGVKRIGRRSKVVVPNVVGRTYDDARIALMDSGLVAVAPDPDGPPQISIAWPSGVVTDQAPESGAKVAAGSVVTLWIGRGGGSAGVREPRRPTPSPRSARQMHDRPEEAVG